MKEFGIKYIKIIGNLIVAALIVVGFYWSIPKVASFFFPVIIGLIIGVLANPLVRFLESRLKLNRKFGSILIIVGVLAGIVVGVYWIIMFMVRQVMNFLTEIPQIVTSIQNIQLDGNLYKIYSNLPIEVQKSLDNLVDQFVLEVTAATGKIGPYMANMAKTSLNNIPILLIYIIFSILCAYFFVADKDKIIEKYRLYCPTILQKGIGIIYDVVSDIIGGYVRAQIKLMGLVAGVMCVCFLVLGIEYGIILAVLISFLDALPFLGTGTILVPWAVMSAISGKYVLGIGLFVTYFLTQLLRRILEPKFVADGIGVHPFLAVLFMFVGFKLEGVLGMIVAVPVGVVIMTVLNNGLLDRPRRIVHTVIEDIKRFCYIEEVDGQKSDTFSDNRVELEDSQIDVEEEASQEEEDEKGIRKDI